MADTQEPQGTSSAATELPAQEWEAQLRAELSGDSAQPTGGEENTSTQARPKPTSNPLLHWLHRAAVSANPAIGLVTGAKPLVDLSPAAAKSRALAIPRGIAAGANEAAQTVAEVSVSATGAPSTTQAALRSVPIVGSALAGAAELVSSAVGHDPEKAKQAEVVSEAQINAVYGPKPTDLVGGLIHATAQMAVVAAPLAATGVGLPVATAIAFGTTLDPYEPTAADFLVNQRASLEKVPYAGRLLYGMAAALKVNEDDSPIEARIKKVIEGEAIGALTKHIFSPVARVLGYTSAAETAQAAKQEARLVEARAGASAELARMNEPRPTDVVRVRKGPNGTSEVVPVEVKARLTDVLEEGQLQSKVEGLTPTDVTANVEYRGGRMLGADDAPARELIQGNQHGPARHVYREPGKSVVIVREAFGDEPPYVEIMFTKPEFREKGLASGLLKQARADFKTRGQDIAINASDLSPQRAAQLAETGTSGRPVFLRDPQTGKVSQSFAASEVSHTTPATGLAKTFAKEGDDLAVAQARDVPDLSSYSPEDIRIEKTKAQARLAAFEDAPVSEAQSRIGVEADKAYLTALDDELAKRAKSPSPVSYSDAAAAQGDAAMVNAAAYDASRASSMFTPDEVRLHFATAERLGQGDLDAISTNPHFNLQSMGTSEAVDAQIAALTSQYGDMLSVAQGRPKVSNEVLHNAAQRWAAEVHLDNFLPALEAAEGRGRIDLSLKAALYNAANKQAAQEIAEVGMLMSAKPGDEALELLARRRLETWLRVAETTANFNTELGRGLQALSARNTPSASAIRFGSGVVPRESITQAAETAPKAFRPIDPQTLTPEKLGIITRLFARSGGDVRVAHFVNETMKKELANKVAEWEGKSMAGKIESRVVSSYISSIISGFKTFATIASSGATISAFQASAKIATGIGKANRGLAEEGAAQFSALFYYSRANMRGAWASFKENRSIIQGSAPFSVDPSKVMKGVTVPGRTAGSLDEFTRQAAYRADEFAAAFRQARDEGIPMWEAAKRADGDVAASIDAETGIGLNSAALKRAGVPTLSDHPGHDTFIGKLSNTLAEFPLTKFIVPFIRPSVNSFRFAHMNTPVLNQFNKEAQRIFQEGGEAASVLHTQATMAGSMMVYAMGKYMTGEISGQGPSDPTLYREWSENHQPYSIRIGNQWVSYRRLEPFATFFGLIADGMEVYHEIPDEDRDELEEKVGAVMGSIFSATTRNTTNKAWTESILNFLTAIDDDKQNGGNAWVRGILAGLVPLSAGIKQFNDDPVWRETRENMSNVRALFPGWSEGTPAQANWAGEIRAKQGSMWNRNFALFPTVEAKPMVEDILVDNFIRVTPPNPRPYPGIDLWDKKWANSNGKLPYEVFMEKMRGTGVRAAVEKLVDPTNRASAFNAAPKGNRTYPDGLRAELVRQVVGQAQERALHQMLAEFPDLARQYNVAKNVIPPIAKYQGQEAANAQKELYGIPTETR